MLLRYIVSNFKSIGHNVEFSMFPVDDNIDERFLTSIETKAGKWKVLRRGALFGPNASGKTSFIESVDYAKEYIVKGPQSNRIAKVNQFRGNIEELNGVTTFQFIIYAHGDVYEYGFSIDWMQVHEEWLYVLGTEDFKPVFERRTDENRLTTIVIEDEYAEKGTEERNIAELLKLTIKEKQADHLFLAKLAENGSEKADVIMSWFKNVQVIYPDTQLQGLPVRLREDDNFRNFFSEQLKALDTGIDNVSVSDDKMDFSEFVDKYDIPDEIVNDIQKVQNGVINFNGKYYIFSEKERGSIIFIQVRFDHLLAGKNKSVPFNMKDESDGTQRMMDIIPILFIIRQKPDAMYFVDELDRSLHTKLSRYFIEQFIKNTADSRNQLVFTAHDVNLLDLNKLCQEEIWFIDKNSGGETQLKPFSDFNLRENQNILKDYLNGRFGAVPVIRGEE